MHTNELMNIDDLAGGGLSERYRDAMNDVLKNIFDPNTDAKKARKLTLTLTIKPSENRRTANVTIDTKTSLIPPKALDTTFIMDKNSEGEVFASEFTGQIPGQQTIAGEEVGSNVRRIGSTKKAEGGTEP